MDKETFVIEGVDCADCALTIEKGVRQLPGVEAVQVNFTSGLMHIQGAVEPEALKKRVEALGYGLGQKDTQRKPVLKGASGFWRYMLARSETRLALIGGLGLVLSVLAGMAGAPEMAVRGLQVAALVVAGYPIARAALASLWINREISINLLMTLAAVGAVVIGETTEAATLIFLFAIAEALEGFSADRARRVLDDMANLAPEQAVRLRGGEETLVPVSSLEVGEDILVRAGERIPMDGSVLTGTSAVNQAPITGESLPVDKTAGDEVFAGTVNGNGTLIVRVTRLAEDTTIQRIIRMIEQAQSSRAPTQRFIDRFAKVYTPLVVVLAALVAAVPPLLFGQPFLNSPDGTGWLYRALALLVIACPCALVISAPVTIVSAITAAARRGVLIKGGAFLERLAEIRVFAFDKTGTLTRGEPVVTGFQASGCQPGDNCADCGDVLALASALERRSTHPLARSVVTAAESLGLDRRYAPAGDVLALAGSGVQGQVNGKLATVGSHRLFDREHPHPEWLCNWVEQAEDRGQTTMMVCDGDQVRGFIAVADTLRPESAQAVADLRKGGAHTVLLTGDNKAAANSVGSQVGVDEVLSNLLPEDKLRSVQELTAQHGPTAMVGDGINDTPALAAAALGIAVGGSGSLQASAQALETADVVLMSGDLSALPFAVRLSTFARRLIRQNVVISLGTKLVFIGLAMAGLTSLWLAVLADVGVSLIVTTNGLRANRYQ